MNHEALASVIDPHFKQLKFLSKEERQAVCNILNNNNKNNNMSRVTVGEHPPVMPADKKGEEEET